MYPTEKHAARPLSWSRSRAQARITHSGTKGAVAVHSPFHGCDVYITPRENLLLMWLGRGKRITYRSIPDVLGYTMSGFRKAIATLRKLGLLGFDSRRGCHGFTRLWSNVSSQFSEGRSFVNRLLLPKVQGGHIRMVEDRVAPSSSPPGPSFRDLMRAAGWTGPTDILEA